jgi:hypothetical protein
VRPHGHVHPDFVHTKTIASKTATPIFLLYVYITHQLCAFSSQKLIQQEEEESKRKQQRLF